MTRNRKYDVGVTRPMKSPQKYDVRMTEKSKYDVNATAINSKQDLFKECMMKTGKGEFILHFIKRFRKNLVATILATSQFPCQKDATRANCGVAEHFASINVFSL